MAETTGEVNVAAEATKETTTESIQNGIFLPQEQIAQSIDALSTSDSDELNDMPELIPNDVPLIIPQNTQQNKQIPEEPKIAPVEVKPEECLSAAAADVIALAVDSVVQPVTKEITQIVENGLQEHIVNILAPSTEVPASLPSTSPNSSPAAPVLTQDPNSIGASEISLTPCEPSTSRVNVNSLENASNETIEEEWERREKALLQKITSLETQQGDTSAKGLQLQLKVKSEENEILRAKVINLETELNAVLRKPNGKNKDIVGKIKKQHEELLTKARGMIFDKTKMIKNQELQIEALTSQVSSLKEVATITKDLLGIRNLEVAHLQERLECMDMKIQAEKERHNLMVKKIETGTTANQALKKEYETQLALFKELKLRYEEKFRMLGENQKPPPASEEGTSGQ